MSRQLRLPVRAIAAADIALDAMLAEGGCSDLIVLAPKLRAARADGQSWATITAAVNSSGFSVSERTLRRRAAANDAAPSPSGYRRSTPSVVSIFRRLAKGG